MQRMGVLLAGLALGGGALEAQDYGPDDYLEARIWLDRGDEPVLQRGDRVRIYYRTSADAYVAIFHVDTDGSVNLLHPRAPDEEHFVRAARDYRLLFPRSQYWYVDEYAGKGYFFLVASPEPFDFSAFAYANYERAWDLSSVGRTVYEDPYLAIDEYVAHLIPDWEQVPYALDFIAYDVGETHDYPRFLCYDCHGFRSYATWNPYSFGCSTYRVVVWDDPYFYPTWRYRGTRVVYAQPRRGVPRFEFKERAVGETWTPMTRTRQPPLRRTTEYVEPSVAMPRGPEVVAPRRATPSETLRRATPGNTGGTAAPPSVRPPARRPSGSTVRPTQPPTGTTRPTTDARRTTPSTRPNPATAGARERPTLQRRPTSPNPTTRPSTSRPSTTRPTTARPTTRPGSRGRVVTPSRPTTSRPSTSRSPTRAPTVRPSRPPTSGSRPTVRPTRPTVKPKAKPPPRRKPGGLEP